MTNKNRIYSIINLLLFFILLLAVAVRISASDVNAAGPWNGYAVYRDGVGIFNMNDHAALMNKTNKGASEAVLHAPGSNSAVQFGNWAQFLDGNSFICICKPKNCSMSSALRASFVAKGRELRGISYILLDQIQYAAGNSNLVKPQHITKLRCDGVIEYVYEWYGYRVGGPNGSWNISINQWENWSAHSGSAITPRKQRKNLLTVVPGEPN